MNPVLVKPEADTRSQVVVLGEVDHEISRLPWRERRAQLWPVVRESLHGLLDDYDVVVIEGAGSPAEINLRDGDIVNMAVALEVAAPVLLCCDIDRGGAFAHLLGTWHCLVRARARRCSRASCSTASAATRRCSRPGPQWLEERTGVPTLGVVPWLDVPLPEEDGVALQGAGGGEGQIAIVALPRIANLDEFAPLGAHARFVRTPAELETAAAIVIPGTKSTLADLDWLRSTGLAGAIARRAAAGVPVLGICGGLQMLGRTVRDPLGIEGGGEAPGLGLLDLVTELQPGKTTRLVQRDRQRDGRAARRLRDPPRRHDRAGASATPTLTGPGRPARLARRQRARELRPRAAGARRLPRRAARRARASRRGHAGEPRRAPLGDRRRRCARRSTGRASAALICAAALAPDLTGCARVPQSHGALRGAERRRDGDDRARLAAAAAGHRHRLPPPRGAAAVPRGRADRRGRRRASSTPTSCSSWSPGRRRVHAARPQSRAQLPGRRRRHGLRPRAGAAVRARGRRAARGDVRRLPPLLEAGAGLRRLRHRRRPAVRAQRPAARLAPPRHAARAADADRQALRRRAGLAARRARLARDGRHRVRRRRGGGARAASSTRSSTSTRRCSTTSACSTRCWSTRPPASP